MTFEDNSIDILHIDGCHTYEATKNDYEKWVCKVKSDGFILFHDISMKERDFGVYRLWDELKEKYQTLEFHHSYGLGVLCKSHQKHMKLFDIHQILNDQYPLMMDNAILKNRLSQERGKIADLRRKVDDLEITVIHHRTSLSWRITAPLRTFKDRFPRFTGWMKYLIRGTESSPNAT